MVAYLQKPEGSEAFHKIMDFLNTSHIKITSDGEVEITASIDRQVKTITEASLRIHLKLEDSDGITSLPNTEIFEQLALMGVDFPLFPTMITTPESSPSRITSSPSLSPQTYQSPQSSPLRDITRQDAEIPQSQFPTQTQVADEAAFTSVDVDAGGAATTDIGLEAGQGSGTMHKTPTRPHDSPLPRVHTLGSDEGSLQQNELMDLVTKLTDRVEVLENDLQQTKKVYSSALTKLILRVKKLFWRMTLHQQKSLKFCSYISSHNKGEEGRRIAKIDQNPSISLVQDEGTSWIQEDVEIQGKTSADIEILLIPEEPTEHWKILSYSTAANLVYIKRSAEKRKDKGKAIMKEDESVQKKEKKQLEQERLGHEEAIRLQEQINEEEKQRIARDAEIAKQLQEEIE
ncbi:hypothetical protein Tco_1270853 [Tanacetum coccineum]